MNFSLALRLVIGWTYFSALWRRLVLEYKLDPEAVGYVGEKFNHFYPNAIFIKDAIEFFLLHPQLLWWKLVIFTIVEGVVGLMLMLGLFTRIASIGVVGLALGILLGAGWLGTTCLDEWQVGVLGMAGGLTLLFMGPGQYSLDQHFGLEQRISKFTDFLNPQKFAIASFFLFGLTLYTNQVFHGGVLGTLHNKSVRPEIELTNLYHDDEGISFSMMRTEGADVYGSFIYRLEVFDLESSELIYEVSADNWEKSDILIENKYIAKVKKHKYSLLAPLGASAQLTIPLDKKLSEYTVKLTDINGSSWGISTADMRTLKNKSLLESIEKGEVLVVDVRTEEEFKKSHISGAILFPLDQINLDHELISQLKNSNRKIVIYCHTGVRAQKAVNKLAELGIQSTNIGGYSFLKKHLK